MKKTIYCGIELDNPLIIASSPLTETAERVKACGQAGAGGVILKTVAKYKRSGQSDGRSVRKGEVREGYYASSSFEREILTIEEGLKLYEKSIAGTSILVIPSVTAMSLDPWDWLPLCREFEQKGASVIQLDLFYMGNILGEDGFGKRLIDLLRTLKDLLKCQIMPKLNITLPPDYICNVLCEAGVKAVSLLDSVRVPYLGNDNADGLKAMIPEYTSFFGPWQLPLTLSYLWSAKKAGLSVCAGGGISCAQDVRLLMRHGASLIQTASAVLQEGFGQISALKSGFTVMKGQNSNHTSAVIDYTKCISCGNCHRQLWCGAVELDNARLHINAQACDGCGFCLNKCPQKAIYLS